MFFKIALLMIITRMAQPITDCSSSNPVFIPFSQGIVHGLSSKRGEICYFVFPIPKVSLPKVVNFDLFPFRKQNKGNNFSTTALYN